MDDNRVTSNKDPAAESRIEYRSHYFDDETSKASFERCTKKVFGLDFSLWKDRGLWDDQYRPFSAFVDGECVASICVYPSAMKVAGEDKRGAQLLTVATLPEYRLRGIQRELWHQAKNWIRQECDFVYLFTHDDAAGLYHSLGFLRPREFTDIIQSPRPDSAVAPNVRKLDPSLDSDFAILERLANEREMVSDRLGFFNPKLLLFMFLYVYPERSYYVEALDAVVAADVTATRVRIHDIVAKETPRLADISPTLGHFAKDEVEFLFCTDRLGLDQSRKEEVKDDILFVDDEFRLDGEFVFPYSIRA